MAAAEPPPLGGGQSRRKTLLLHGDPTAVAATAAAARWAKEFWPSANAQQAGALMLTELKVSFVEGASVGDAFGARQGWLEYQQL